MGIWELGIKNDGNSGRREASHNVQNSHFGDGVVRNTSSSRKAKRVSFGSRMTD